MNIISSILMTVLFTLSSGGWYSDSSESKDSSNYYWKRPKPKRTKKEKCDFGVITGFFGALEDIPSGYQLCDGSNDTPDLRDRFLVGAGDNFAFGDTGGSSSVALAVENLPSHAHGAGGLVTEEAGEHNHDFSALTHEGGHIHEVIGLDIKENGVHLHEIDLQTEQDGDHKHTFKAFDPETYDTLHSDFDVPLKKIDTEKSYPIETDEDPGHKHEVKGDTEEAGLHGHDIDGTVGSPDDGKHEHEVLGTTEDAGIHIHEINGDTAPVGDGEDVHILPPFNAVYWICCAKPKDKPKPKWYSN